MNHNLLESDIFYFQGEKMILTWIFNQNCFQGEQMFRKVILLSILVAATLGFLKFKERAGEDSGIGGDGSGGGRSEIIGHSSFISRSIF